MANEMLQQRADAAARIADEKQAYQDERDQTYDSEDQQDTGAPPEEGFHGIQGSFEDFPMVPETSGKPGVPAPAPALAAPAGFASLPLADPAIDYSSLATHPPALQARFAAGHSFMARATGELKNYLDESIASLKSIPADVAAGAKETFSEIGQGYITGITGHSGMDAPIRGLWGAAKAAAGTPAMESLNDFFLSQGLGAPEGFSNAAVLLKDGRLARLEPTAEGGMTTKIIGPLPRPEDFQRAAQNIVAQAAAKSEVTPYVAQNLLALWDKAAISPAEVHESAMANPVYAHDLSAARVDRTFPDRPAGENDYSYDRAAGLPPPVQRFEDFFDQVTMMTRRLKGARIANKIALDQLYAALPPGVKTPDLVKRFNQAAEGDPVANLTMEEQALFDEHFRPVANREKRAWDIAQQYDLPLEEFNPNFQHRERLTDTPKEGPVEGGPTPYHPGGEFIFAQKTGSMYPRSDFTIVNLKGDRQSVIRHPDGNIELLGPDGTKTGTVYTTEATLRAREARDAAKAASRAADVALDQAKAEVEKVRGQQKISAARLAEATKKAESTFAAKAASQTSRDTAVQAAMERADKAARVEKETAGAMHAKVMESMSAKQNAVELARITAKEKKEAAARASEEADKPARLGDTIRIEFKKTAEEKAVEQTRLAQQKQAVGEIKRPGQIKVPEKLGRALAEARNDMAPLEYALRQAKARRDALAAQKRPLIAANKRVAAAQEKVDKIGQLITRLQGQVRAQEPLSPATEPWTLMNAWVREIKAVHPERNYREHAWANKLENIERLEAINLAAAEITKLRNSPEWETYTWRPNSGRERPEGWIAPDVPMFRNDVMPHKLAHLFNDLYTKRPTDDLHDFLLRANRLSITSLFTTGPVWHIGNVLNDASVARGWEFFNPVASWRSTRFIGTAIKETWTQGPVFQRLLREGAGIMDWSNINYEFRTRMEGVIDRSLQSDPAAWQGLANKLKMPLPALQEAWKFWTGKSLWLTTNVLLVHRILELESRGIATSKAIQLAEKHIINYQLAPEIANSRFLKEVLTSPLLTAFPRYHIGRFNSVFGMTKDLAAGAPKAKIDAAGHLAVMMVHALFTFPLASMAIEKAFDNDRLKLPAFGSTALVAPLINAAVQTDLGQEYSPEFLKHYYNGDSHFVNTLINAFTPSPLLKIAIQNLLANRDLFTGKPIMEPADIRKGNWGRISAQEAESLVGTAVMPMGAIDTAIRQGKPWYENLVASVFGLTSETPRKEQKIAAGHKREENEAQYRASHPRGLIEKLYGAMDKFRRENPIETPPQGEPAP